MAFREKRDWTKATIARAHDTRALAARGGGHGNAGSLTFSFPLELTRQFLQRHCNGREIVHMRLTMRGNQLFLAATKDGEHGRKLSLSTTKTGYRLFFDGANYPWIRSIKPFGATVTEAKLDHEGIVVTMPPEKDRNPIEPYVQYAPRRRHPYPPVHVPAPQPIPAPAPAPAPAPVVLLPEPTGKLYLVMVPPEKDQQFHTLLRFLQLEALKE